MKNKDFNRKLEIILENLEKIDCKIKESLRTKSHPATKSSSYDSQISDTKYNTEKIVTENKYQ